VNQLTIIIGNLFQDS